ncbi:neprilysin-11-like [Rhipicephalus sanguineus]|uniref:neprilysin-11-like n=1 Tax=Rhipicephalus sanguineus TaxID=34632 RepID=UPI0020C475C2|nr:neprilysin-11-like [Rhipicephalus sanguineus]
MYAINDNMPHNLRLKNTSNMDTHNLTLIDDIVSEFFTKSKIELVTYVATLAIAELLRYDFNRQQNDVATCLQSSYLNFPEPLMSLFVNEHIKKSIVDNFRIFFENIKKEVLDTVSSFDWMDQNTRIKARVKVSTVGLRTVESTTREVNADEEKMSGDFMANYVAIARYNKKRANRYPEPSTKLQQNLDLIIGNVYVDYEKNVISVPARDLLEPVFFEDAKEKFVNLSYIGSTVAAEMVSVAFSPSGSRYAAGGLQIDWWPERVNTSYDKRLRCYLSEYRQLSKDFVHSGNFSADATPPSEVLEYLMTYSRGLEISYKMADITDTSNKQLFFTRFCQALCDSNANKNTYARKSLNVRLACMYPLLHSEGFREAFECEHTHTLYPKESCPRL